MNLSLNYDHLINQATSFHQNGDFEKAEFYYLKILNQWPNNTAALTNLATLALQLGKINLGLELIEKSLKVNQNQPSALNNHGVFLQRLNRNEEALVSFDRAINYQPEYAEAHANKANSLSLLKNFEEAQKSYDLAIHFKPDYLKAFLNKGRSLKENGHFKEALLSFNQGQKLNPDVDFISGELLETQMHLNIWDDFEKHLSDISIKINSGKVVINPFPLLGLLDNPGLQRKCAETYSSLNYSQSSPSSKIEPYLNHSKIRIGYFSSDFHNHATMHLMAELFESHNKEKFEIFAFSFGPNKNDSWRDRVKSSVDEFLDVSLVSDYQVTLLAKEKEIDIAIDLKGYTHNSRPKIFSEGCAPIQVSYLGYPGTMGAKFIDYLIADRVLIPKKEQKYYSEKIVYMPDSYQVNMSKRTISKSCFSRENLGLPEKGFVFCCFNNNYKVTPSTFASWARILKAVDSSVLWLFETNSFSSSQLKKEATKYGVHEKRLVFAKRLPVEEHLSRIKQADLFLDTLPYNAHTTCSDALRVELPILTLIGKSFASRVAASLLESIDLSELIVSSMSEYESLAIELALNPKKLSNIKNKIATNLLSTSLFDSQLFTKKLEEAYSKMNKAGQNNSKHQHIYINH